MKTRRWPYGTKLDVDVLAASKFSVIVRHQFEDKHGESFILFGHGLDPLPALDSKGFITFTQGGPTGGYWKFSTT